MSQVETHLAQNQQTLDRLYKRCQEIDQQMGKLEMERDDIDRVIRALEPAHRRLRLSAAAELSFDLDETFNPSDDGEGSGTEFERLKSIGKTPDKPLVTPQIEKKTA